MLVVFLDVVWYNVVFIQFVCVVRAVSMSVVVHVYKNLIVVIKLMMFVVLDGVGFVVEFVDVLDLVSIVIVWGVVMQHLFV